MSYMNRINAINAVADLAAPEPAPASTIEPLSYAEDVFNAAAMREMLRRIDRLCRVTDDEAGTAWNMDIAHRVRDEIQAALDMPARNCDRTFADHVAMYDEFKAWCNAKGHTMNPKLASDAFDWLLSKAEGAE